MKKNLPVLFVVLLVFVLIGGCRKSRIDLRDAYEATYLASETWQENNVPRKKPEFTMSVLKSTQSEDKIILSNFANYGSGIIVEAVVNGSAISIPQQTLTNSKTISGSGRLENMMLTLIYTEDFGSLSFVVTVNAKRL